MILVVGFNLAVDLVSLAGEPADCARRYPAGKAMNVARLLASFGHPVTLTGLVGADEESFFAAAIERAGIENALQFVAGATRVNVKEIDPVSGSETQSNQPGPSISSAELGSMRERFAKLSMQSRQIVLTGSLPPGVPSTIYDEFIRAARHRAVSLDTSGAALVAGVQARPNMIKINTTELSELTARVSADQETDLIEVRQLVSAGTEMVVVTRSSGAIMVTRDNAWCSTVPRQAARNPIGAGDAFLAGLLDARIRGLEPRAALALATATGAAAVATEDPGMLSTELRDELLDFVVSGSYIPTFGGKKHAFEVEG
jgi:1-phosphofructokinase family hexose kinase